MISCRISYSKCKIYPDCGTILIRYMHRTIYGRIRESIFRIQFYTYKMLEPYIYITSYTIVYLSYILSIFTVGDRLYSCGYAYLYIRIFSSIYSSIIREIVFVFYTITKSRRIMQKRNISNL